MVGSTTSSSAAGPVGKAQNPWTRGPSRRTPHTQPYPSVRRHPSGRVHFPRSVVDAQDRSSPRGPTWDDLPNLTDPARCHPVPGGKGVSYPIGVKQGGVGTTENPTGPVARGWGCAHSYPRLMGGDPEGRWRYGAETLGRRGKETTGNRPTGGLRNRGRVHWDGRGVTLGGPRDPYRTLFEVLGTFRL